MYIKTGFLIGITSLIPGISGGTILMLSGNCNDIYNAITNYKENFLNLVKLVLGIILGAIFFAKIMELLFKFMPNGLLIIISTLVILSSKDLKNSNKLNIFFIILGAILILFLGGINPNTGYYIEVFPEINLLFLLEFTFFGLIDGFFTIIPGISGSMILMILGPYFLYKSLLANVTNNLIFSIPLLTYFIGDMLGIFIGSKFSLFCFKKIPNMFTSIILGMILASSLVLIPIMPLNIFNILKYIFFIFLGILINKFNQMWH